MPTSTHGNNNATIKWLPPGAPGTKRLVERFEEAPPCTRYRHDPLRNGRLTTVELIIEAINAERSVGSRIAYGEAELHLRIKEAGGNWHAERKLWLMPRKKIKALKRESRIVPNGQYWTFRHLQ